MTTLQRVLDLLEKLRVPYTHTSHPVAYTARDVAAAEHLSPHHVAKTVVFFAEQGYGMAVVPADAVVDLEELRKAVHSSHLRLATEAEIGTLFPESELGAMPPIGVLFNLPVIVDEEIAHQEYIAFNAGTHRDVIHMSYGDFARVANSVTAHVGRAVAAAGH